MEKWKPGPGRFREFLQFDADFVCTKNLQADAELCVMISEILENCGLNKKEYIIKISSRKITEEIFQKIKIESNEQKLTALRALDKIDRLGWDGVKQLLGKGRKDKSGDFTSGANLSSKNIDFIEKELKNKSSQTEDLKEILKIFSDYNFNNFEIDPLIGDWTMSQFLKLVKFDVKNNKGQVVSLDQSVAADTIINNFGKYDAPATGTYGLDRLVYALMQKKFKLSKPNQLFVMKKFNEGI